MSILITILLLFSFSMVHAQSAKSVQEINLNWQFHQVGKANWYPAIVPGCVHSDLLRNKQIPDPFYRDNEKLVQWIETEDWEYLTSFSIEQNQLSESNIELVFNGLDTYADVYLNDSLVLQANNMYRSWTIECKKLLKPENNSLRIVFHSAVNEGLRRAGLYTYRLPNHNEKTEDLRKCSSQTRKSPYQFGWDTHPRLVTSGIWRPIVLKAWSNAKLVDIFAEAIIIEKEKAVYNIKTNISSENGGKYSLAVFLENSTSPIARKSVKLQKGINDECLYLEIKNPELWWPNGMGKPNLYNIKVTLSDESSLLDEKSEKIGVRTIELIRENDSIGKSFYFRVNGIPVFIKGSNYVPSEAIVTNSTTDQYTSLIQNAKKANLNMLRVWGGAIYENDIFYDLCAENGIMVWQDFMYACSMYPGDSAFLENIKQETIENVKRLCNNPALAIWCGNNELISGWYEWGWPKKTELNISQSDSAKIFQDYLKIFNDIIPEVIKQYNPQTFYWPSSPGSEPGIPSSLESGDLHYYFVWYGSYSIQMYKKVIPRFMSEYGVQSLPSWYTCQKYLAPEDENLFSPVMMHRQKSVMPWITPDMEGNKMLMRYILEDYNPPKDFQSLIYLSQLFQADAIKIASEAHRTNKPRCMGTMFWQFGDAWPNIGWSVIDYLGKKKAGFYSAKKAFSNILVIPALSDTAVGPETILNVYINSDSIKVVKGELSIKLLDFNGRMVFNKEINVSVSPLSNEVFFSVPLNEILNGLTKEEMVLLTELKVNGSVISENLLYFDHPKSLLLKKPEIQTIITQTKTGYEIEFFTNTLAKSVYLSLPNGDDDFSDNFFDILPDRNVKIQIITSLSLEELKTKLVIKSLIDSWQ